MKKIKCIIVDDEALARKLLENYVRQVPHLELMDVFKNPMEAMSILQTEAIDLMFLDIQMPQITGINFIKILTNKPLVVFTTAYEKYALEGYALDVIDYLLKPFGFERFLQAVNKASARLLEPSSVAPTPLAANAAENTPDTKDYILVKSEHRIYRLKFSEILYIQSMQAYVAYYTKKERILSLHRMKTLEEELPGDKFIRVHKSYIVAIDKIELLEGNQLVINDTKIPIGAIYKEIVLAKAF
jgi:DNA-binding LytR/AlgR family response regulator